MLNERLKQQHRHHMHAKIAAIAPFLPPEILSNESLASRFPGTTAEDIYRLSGIRYRHTAASEVTPSDLAFEAAQILFEQHPEHDRRTVDAILFCSEGLDYKAPATACLLHHRLNLAMNCLAMDIPGGCTGFVNGLLVAKSLIAQNQQIRTVLLLTAETVTKVIHDDDLHLRMLFGDGACATLLTRSDTSHIGDFILGTDGSGQNALWVERSGFRNPADAQWLESHQHTTHGMRYGRLLMQGDALLHFALKRVPDLVHDTLLANNLSIEDIDLFIFHQASLIILKYLKRKTKIDSKKFFICLEEQGNTVSSSIPIALDSALKKGAISSGNKVMLVGFGVGLSWAATVIDVV